MQGKFFSAKFSCSIHVLCYGISSVYCRTVGVLHTNRPPTPEINVLTPTTITSAKQHFVLQNYIDRTQVILI